MRITSDESESTLQQLAQSFAKFNNLEIKDSIREALGTIMGKQDILERFCQAVFEYSGGVVRMRPVSFEERVKIFGIEVIGPADYFVLESVDRTQLIILTPNGAIFDRGQR